MSYGKKSDGKDTIYFLTKEDVEVATPLTPAEDQSAAFDPQTGEINWDCPCLGGMAKGPCGEEFKQAFSCFVFSQTETKGSDCIGAFRAMQSCFQEYPEYYADQLHDESQSKSEQETSANTVDGTVEETLVVDDVVTTDAQSEQGSPA
jgi:hypothetical protein